MKPPTDGVDGPLRRPFWLVVSRDLIERNLQPCSSLFAIPFLKFTFPTLESDKFLFGRLIGVFAAGYGLRAWMSTRRRQAMRKARGD